MKRIPSYDDCCEIVKNNTAFYETKRTVDGNSISIFNYLIAMYNDFASPIKNQPEIDAFELRGLTFIHSNDNKLSERYLMLHKFFNMNQSEIVQYNEVKNKKIINIQEKLDGSMISFIKLNGKILARTKMGFDNEIALMAQKVFNNSPEIIKFVSFCIENKLYPIFEFTSPFNRIVLQYLSDSLSLLQVRDEFGNYLGIYECDYDFNKKLIPNVIEEYMGLISQLKRTDKYADFNTLDECIESLKGKEDFEGYVVTFDDGTLMKLKTEWYCERHKLLTEDLAREDYIIDAVLNEKLDDLIVVLDDKDPRKKYVENIASQISEAFNKEVYELFKLASSYDLNTMTRVEFINKNKTHSLLYHALYIIPTLKNPVSVSLERAIDTLKKYYLKSCYKLFNAREQLIKWNINFQKVCVDSDN